jgi:hypothetical protein
MVLLFGGCERSDASGESDGPSRDRAAAGAAAGGAAAEAGGKMHRASAAGSEAPLMYGGRFVEPQPPPALPAAFDPFDPPAIRTGEEGAPGFSEWTRTAGPDEHVLLAGHNYRPGQGRMRFEVFAQTAAGTFRRDAKIAHLTAHQALVRLPAAAPAHAMYLVFPRAGEEVGGPAAVNRAEMWYVLPKTASPGQACSAFGRNLSHRGGEERAWVYLKAKGAGELGLWCEVTAANPYKVDFVPPEGLPHGTYEVWAHNGHGGRYGWAPLHAGRGGTITPQYLKVGPAHQWDGPTLDATRFGADGTDGADDSEAVRRALAKANQTPNATIFFPAGTYHVSKTIEPVTGPEKSGIRILGAGKYTTAIKGLPGKAPNPLMRITGGRVELRDLTLDINVLGEKRKYYRGADRGEHNPAHYAALEKVARARRAIKRWKRRKENKGADVPEAMKPPEVPHFPDVAERHRRVASAKKRGGGTLIQKTTWAGGLTIVNCVLDAERCNIDLLKGGISEGMLDNCDVVGREIKLGCPKFARVRNCHFFARGDTGVILYMYGGWCNSFTNNVARDYMPNTFDTGQGRWYTVSAYGNRQENIYIGHNRTKDLTVNPMYYDQNRGEQIMWEFMPITSTQTPTRVEGRTLTFAEKIKGKVKWYSDAIVVAGRGMGQYRRVAEHDEKTRTIEVVRPWDVTPDTDSVIQIGRPMRRVVVYDNYLDAKPRAYQAEHHIAAAGVVPFGASLDLTVERNTFHELRAGIGTFSPYLWHRYARNTFHTNRYGMRIGEGTGAMVRHNKLINIVTHGCQTSSGEKWPSMKLEAYEHNRGAGVPVAFRLGNRYKKDVKKARIVVYGNRFARGGSAGEASVAIQAVDPNDVIREKNAWQGYARTIGPE